MEPSKSSLLSLLTVLGAPSAWRGRRGATRPTYCYQPCCTAGLVKVEKMEVKVKEEYRENVAIKVEALKDEVKEEYWENGTIKVFFIITAHCIAQARSSKQAI